jgi:hypothetical protein
MWRSVRLSLRYRRRGSAHIRRGNDGVLTFEEAATALTVSGAMQADAGAFRPSRTSYWLEGLARGQGSADGQAPAGANCEGRRRVPSPGVPRPSEAAHLKVRIQARRLGSEPQAHRCGFAIGGGNPPRRQAGQPGGRAARGGEGVRKREVRRQGGRRCGNADGRAECRQDARLDSSDRRALPSGRSKQLRLTSESVAPVAPVAPHLLRLTSESPPPDGVNSKNGRVRVSLTIRAGPETGPTNSISRGPH